MFGKLNIAAIENKKDLVSVSWVIWLMVLF